MVSTPSQTENNSLQENLGAKRARKHAVGTLDEHHHTRELAAAATSGHNSERARRLVAAASC
jgi:hypothetical protein